MSFMIQSVIQLCVLETTILFHAAAMTLLTKWWLNSSDGQDSLPTPLSFVTINIGGDAPIIIQTDRTQTETHQRISDYPINKTERESRCGGLRQRIMISWSWGNCNWYLQLTRIRIDFTMWWIVEPENCDIVILGQLWQQEIRESLPVVPYPVVVDQILGNIHYVYEDDQLNQKPKSTWGCGTFQCNNTNMFLTVEFLELY